MHSSVDEHLGCFYVLVIVNSAAVNIGVHVSFHIIVPNICPGVGLLDHMATLFLAPPPINIYIYFPFLKKT